MYKQNQKSISRLARILKRDIYMRDRSPDDNSFKIMDINKTKTLAVYYINVRENRRSNQEWTIQRHWQHWAYKTQYEDKENAKTQH